MLEVVSGAAPVSTPCGRGVETVPVALVIISVAGTAAVEERRARARELALALVIAAFGGVFFKRLIP